MPSVSTSCFTPTAESFDSYVQQLPSSLNNSIQPLLTAWTCSDTFFQSRPFPEAFPSVPISLRNPFLFYLGHLPSFTINTLCKYIPQLSTLNPNFDHLFSRGRDPDVDDPSKCHSHPQPPPEWPSLHSTWSYLYQTRYLVLQALKQIHPFSQQIQNVVSLIIEHEYMHIETLHYMLVQYKRTNSSPCCHPAKQTTKATLPSKQLLESIQWIHIPSGDAATGIQQSDSHFQWDNESDTSLHHVPAFHMAKYPISVSQYKSFVFAGGYRDPTLWHPSDWEWLQTHFISHPQTWQCYEQNHQKHYTNLTGGNDDSPVSVSLSEALAFANWIQADIMSELQWICATCPRSHPSVDSNIYDSPRSVTSGNASCHGVVSLLENGWELTNTVFKSFPGFVSHDAYPEYSADFFDDKHFVLRGSSWVTNPYLRRSSFRNFYQARYPYVFSKFRLVKN